MLRVRRNACCMENESIAGSQRIRAARSKRFPCPALCACKPLSDWPSSVTELEVDIWHDLQNNGCWLPSDCVCRLVTTGARPEPQQLQPAAVTGQQSPVISGHAVSGRMADMLHLLARPAHFDTCDHHVPQHCVTVDSRIRCMRRMPYMR